MRIAEFRNLLCRFNITKFWIDNYGTVLFEPLAQHYDLRTEWLDITNDLSVALFFATCFWDGKKWNPLTRNEAETEEDNKYGYIFHKPKWREDLDKTLSIMKNSEEKDIYNEILPLGYQPFLRCHSQYVYAIHMKKVYSLQEGKSFEKLFFRHNEKLSKKVFEMMDGGEKIYPKDELNDLQDVIEMIKNATVFSDESFEYAMKKTIILKIKILR